jgi:hypothetical protein
MMADDVTAEGPVTTARPRLVPARAGAGGYRMLGAADVLTVDWPRPAARSG